MIVMGGALYNFGLVLLRKKLKKSTTSWHLHFSINEKPNKVQLLADARQKSCE